MGIWVDTTVSPSGHIGGWNVPTSEAAFGFVRMRRELTKRRTLQHSTEKGVEEDKQRLGWTT